MTITSLPTRGAGDLGAALTNTRAPVSNEFSAVNLEKIKDRLIEIFGEVGLSDGSTAGSLVERVDALESAGSGGFTVTNVTGNASLADSDQIVTIDTTGGALTVTLPAPTNGRVYVLRKVSGDASGTITLAPHSGAIVIDGSAGSGVLQGSDFLVDETATRSGQPYASWWVWSNGTNWRTMFASPSVINTWGRSGAPVDGVDALPSGYTPGSTWHDGSSIPGRLYIQGGVDASDAGWIRLDGVDVSALTASATLDRKDRLVTVDTTSGVAVLTLPPPEDSVGRQYLVQKINTGTNKITLERFNTEEINGVAADYDLPDSDAADIGRWHVICDGTDWWVG